VLNSGAGMLYVYANDTCLPIVVDKDCFSKEVKAPGSGWRLVWGCWRLVGSGQCVI
jgi:hypothetical protein